MGQGPGLISSRSLHQKGDAKSIGGFHVFTCDDFASKSFHHLISFPIQNNHEHASLAVAALLCSALPCPDR
jgi:hypothetical protein